MSLPCPQWQAAVQAAGTMGCPGCRVYSIGLAGNAVLSQRAARCSGSLGRCDYANGTVGPTDAVPYSGGSDSNSNTGNAGNKQDGNGPANMQRRQDRWSGNNNNDSSGWPWP